ncbi:MAG TPA: dTDP-4-dehydrorhamnose 3,5-epimerase [Pirellulales bacterium]|jgi:dTDP-4-dehydrorhamnose 3,5-epimerase
MKITETDLPGVRIIEPRVFRDERGYFLETWSQARYQEAGLPENMLQDNLSWSRRGVLRGLHFQHPSSQGKLVQVLAGQIFDVVVDVRLGSPHFGRWIGVDLSLENNRQLYIPEGFAHGFCVVSATALVTYKCSEVYRPDCEVGVAWNDPRIGVRWPIASPIISPKDAALHNLHDLTADLLPQYSQFADHEPVTRKRAHAA